MSTIHGTYHNGQVDLDTPVSWPDGARVKVIPRANLNEIEECSEVPAEKVWGYAEETYQDTNEFRQQLIARMRSFPALEVAPEDEAEWQAARQWMREHNLAAVRQQMGLEP